MFDILVFVLNEEGGVVDFLVIVLVIEIDFVGVDVDDLLIFLYI